MLENQDAFHRIYHKAMRAFEHVPVPPPYTHPSDIFLIMSPDGNRDAFHIWLDAEMQTAFGRRIYWRYHFDDQRLKNRLMSSKYGQDEVPTLRTTDHIICYDELMQHKTVLLGAVPAQVPPRDEEHIEIRMRLRIRLPLGEMDIIRTGRGGEIALMERCRVFHRWLLTMPRIR